MELLTQELRERLPAIGATENEDDPIVQAKFFYPDASWTWYAIEFDGTNEFFGLVDGFEQELGYFTLSELLENRGKLGLRVERDLDFAPCRLSELKAKIAR
jgi:hypothetical protein